MLFETVISTIKNSNDETRKLIKTGLNMQNICLKIINNKKSFTFRNKLHKKRSIPKKSGKF